MILTLTTADDLIVDLISKGLSHTALGQLDKHSDKHALQRVSSSVIDACSQTDNILRTEVPELIRPWFTTDHDQIIRPLFIINTIFKGYCLLHRDTPLPRRTYVRIQEQ